MFVGLKTKLFNIQEIWHCLRLRIMFENRDEIQKKGIIHTKRYFYKKILFNPIRIYRVFSGKELNLRYVEVVLTTFCTLNCKGCSALMPLYPISSRRHIDSGVLSKSIKELFNTADYIDLFRLLGGEPLLYPNLYEVLLLMQSQTKVNHVEIVTNGTVTIKDDRVIRILQDDKFSISISDYGSGNQNKLIRLLDNNRIKYTINHMGGWLDFGDVTEKGWSQSELGDNFLLCKRSHKQCNSILNGKLYLCFRESHGANLELSPVRKEEFIDLSVGGTTSKKQLFSFVWRTSYIEACKYCGLSRRMNRLPVAQQV